MLERHILTHLAASLGGVVIGGAVAWWLTRCHYKQRLHDQALEMTRKHNIRVNKDVETVLEKELPIKMAEKEKARREYEEIVKSYGPPPERPQSEEELALVRDSLTKPKKPSKGYSFDDSNKDLDTDYYEPDPEADEDDIYEEPEVNAEESPYHWTDTDGELEQDFDKPFIISIEDFTDSYPGCEISELRYFAGDDTLCDSEDDLIQGVVETIGPLALSNFGYLSNDTNTVYVRNMRWGIDIEVLFSPERYGEVVLGFQPGDEPDWLKQRYEIVAEHGPGYA